MSGVNVVHIDAILVENLTVLAHDVILVVVVAFAVEIAILVGGLRLNQPLGVIVVAAFERTLGPRGKLSPLTGYEFEFLLLEAAAVSN